MGAKAVKKRTAPQRGRRALGDVNMSCLGPTFYLPLYGVKRESSPYIPLFHFLFPLIPSLTLFSLNLISFIFQNRKLKYLSSIK